MCGIVGYTGPRPAIEILLQGLKYLEYRGYDSAGIALHTGESIEIRKSRGRLENIEKLLLHEDPQPYRDSTCGIGHTRWATHGKATSENAHPHKTGHVVLVHNGIIENYTEIRKLIIQRGHTPLSETDSELIGFLILDVMKNGIGLAEATRQVAPLLKGHWSIVLMSEKEPDTVIGVRNGSPLVAAMDQNGNTLIASDAQPILPFTSNVIFLDQGKMVIGKRGRLDFLDLVTGIHGYPTSTHLDWTPDVLEKSGFEHYMLKEIYEQPQVMRKTLSHLINRTDKGKPHLLNTVGLEILKHAEEIFLIACGTSWHAALLGKYWIERIAKVQVQVELASEFRYRDAVVKKGSVLIGISQSGETADTLVVIREMKKRKVATIGITNIKGSTLSREVDAAFYTMAGPEIGVAATKTFMAQLLVLFIFALNLGSENGALANDTYCRYLSELDHVSDILATHFSPDSELVQRIRETIYQLPPVRGFFFVGRGYSYPLALEGALKLKEISYDHAEGYAAGELKHGPIAMLDAEMVVVALIPADAWRDKAISNIEEVKARGALICGIGHPSDQDFMDLCNFWIPLPSEISDLEPNVFPFIQVPYIQLLSYFRALYRERDIDKPRNLAKSVTVE